MEVYTACMVKKDQEYHDFVVYDLFDGIEGVTSRSMFGGWGIYKDGVFFALIIEGVLYCKVNAQTKERYSVYGSEPFRYHKKGGEVVILSYWALPEEVQENRVLLQEWIAESVDVARRSKKK
jgi:DNA transformation protein and related proteins